MAWQVWCEVEWKDCSRQEWQVCCRQEWQVCCGQEWQQIGTSRIISLYCSKRYSFAAGHSGEGRLIYAFECNARNSSNSAIKPNLSIRQIITPTGCNRVYPRATTSIRVQPSAKFKKIQINFAIPIIIYTFAIPKRDDSLAQ